MRFDNEQYMAQEEKDILIADLCGRLPYGLIIKCNDGFRQSKEKLVSIDVGNGLINYDWRLTDIKPFLRPMSSMTEEERQEYGLVLCDELTTNQFDWLNRKMFDHRGLITIGLALEAPKGVYNN